MSYLRKVPPALILVVAFAATTCIAATVPVAINGLSFSPNPVTVKEGDTIIWTNNTILNHTVTSGSPCTADGTFNSGLFSQGQSFQRVFSTAGTIPYFCIPHCLSGMTGTIIVEPAPTGIGDLPVHSAALKQNYPNPFNPATTIAYVVNRSTHVEITVYNASGRLIQRLESVNREPGTYTVEWTGVDGNGVAQASGVYYYRLVIGNTTVDSRKMVLLK